MALSPNVQTHEVNINIFLLSLFYVPSLGQILNYCTLATSPSLGLCLYFKMCFQGFLLLYFLFLNAGNNGADLWGEVIEDHSDILLLVSKDLFFHL